MKAALYIRVSTEEQKLKGYSLPEQVDVCRKKAQELGATDFEVFADEGESGAYIDRPELERLLTAVKTKDFQFVIAMDTDRLSRDLGIQIFIAKEVEKYAKLDFVTYSRGDPNNPEDNLFFHIKGAFAQYDRAKIRRNTAYGRKRKALMGKVVVPGGWPGHPGAFGYNYSNSEFEINPEEAETVKYVFELAYYKELSPTKIANHLNQKHIPAPKGGKWYPGPIRRMLLNEIYAGTFYNNKFKTITTGKRTLSGKRQTLRRERPVSERHPVSVPAIIERDVWETVQTRIKTNTITSKKNHQALLQGKIRCMKCGRLYSAQSGGKAVYYRCTGRCKMPLLQVKAFDKLIWEEVIKYISNPEIIKEQLNQPNNKEIEKLEFQIDKLKQKQDNIEKHKDELLTLRMENLITADKLKKQLLKVDKKYKEINTEITTLQTRLSLLKKPLELDIDQFCLYFKERIQSEEFEEKLQVIKSLDITIKIYPSKLVEIDWPFNTATLNLNPIYKEQTGFSMTKEIKTVLSKCDNRSEIIRKAILEAPLDVEYKKAPRGKREYSSVCLTEDTYIKLQQLQGTYHESAMRIIEWAIERHLKHLGLL